MPDPMSRLRYLRRAMSADPERKAGLARNRRRSWITLALVTAGVLAFVPGWNFHPAEARAALTRRLAEPSFPEDRPVEPVWLVERKAGEEIYSNGLRIELAAETAHEPRRPMQARFGEWEYVTGSVHPAGIVYHTTESHIAPFEASHNIKLQRAGEWLIAFLRKEKAYHYLIDRFGRVHRIVPEEHAANHAGASMWSSGKTAYLDLNQSFLGLALESETAVGDRMPDWVTKAQIHAARVLTAMLRSRYRIPANDCVTHAQVSLNPSAFLVGNHVDWSANFPFAEVGLPDNYALPLACLYRFGFQYDPVFVGVTGSRMWKGLSVSEEHLRQQATAQGLPVAEYRRQLRRHYQDTAGRLRIPGMDPRGQPLQRASRPGKEPSHEP